ncbi:hypothetical protein BABINDRAFT_159200 [Babjeviella inositovora NRRL Y-12698]|uniref:Uncharacterized protein n=1 Tax=Babjeviella inositovora NRRL Y-12698 TaxID=984486 RepID=A0A1E3QYB5_9ASCO|nr:uncharacterized protein BABINDRAFT_159200 [Babjeviella inositovora NRRL Y-12698]ODQ82669.1 hypothetical protein BABINDRAFT_159200 [Babjeviella inositovora NRRL Y-12698]
MHQNLAAYEKIFSRAHANYLAQLQAMSLNSEKRISEMLSKLTVLGTVSVPLHIIAGLFGMNVTIPGYQQGNVKWFGGIIGVMIPFIIFAYIGTTFWFNRTGKTDDNDGLEAKSLSRISFKSRRYAAKSIRSLPSGRFNNYV